MSTSTHPEISIIDHRHELVDHIHEIFRFIDDEVNEELADNLDELNCSESDDSDVDSSSFEISSCNSMFEVFRCVHSLRSTIVDIRYGGYEETVKW